MFQTVLMLLSSPQNAARTETHPDRPTAPMATRARPALAPGYAGTCANGLIDGWTEVRKGDPKEGRKEALKTGSDAVRIEAREDGQVTLLTIVGNALGFALLMAGLWLLVRLAESLTG